MVQFIESLVGLSIGQFGLVLDMVGFVVIFIFGGFQFGISTYIADDSAWYVLPARIIGSIMVLVGFYFQFLGASQ